MTRSQTRRIRRKIDLDGLVLDGDLTAKLTYIVGASRRSDDFGKRYYNDADFVERAIETAVEKWEADNHDINLTTSGLSVIPPEK